MRKWLSGVVYSLGDYSYKRQWWGISEFFMQLHRKLTRKDWTVKERKF